MTYHSVCVVVKKAKEMYLLLKLTRN